MLAAAACDGRLTQAGFRRKFTQGRLGQAGGALAIRVGQDPYRSAAIDVAGHAAARGLLQEMRKKRHLAAPGCAVDWFFPG